MEWMVKVVKPFYTIKCIVGWLGYTMLSMYGCEDVLDTDQNGSSTWGFARPISC